MNDLLETLLAAAGLGGFCVGLLLVIFKETLRAKFISKLSKEHSFEIVKTIIWLTWSISVLGLIAWAGMHLLDSQRRSVSEQAIQPVAEEQVLAPTLSKKVFDLKVPDTTPGTNVNVATIHLEYVEISGLQDAVLERKINESIKGSIGVNEQYDGSEDLTMLLRSVSLEGNLLSVLVEGTYYGHGAAGAANQVVSINLNVENGDPVQFKDLFRAGYQERLDKLTQEWLALQRYSNHFGGVTDDQCYYFDGGYLYLCFSEYEVAPGAEGIVSAPIRLEEIRGLISRNGPLAYVL